MEEDDEALPTDLFFGSVHARGNNNVKPPLTRAIENGDENEVRQLLATGADVNQFGYFHGYGEPPIVTAIKLRHKNLAALLLSHSANVNAASERGHTPLIRAAQRNDTRLQRLLLRHGADPNAVDHSRLCAIFWAVKFQNSCAVADLLAHGADVNIAIQKGSSVLHTAATTGNVAIAALLIDRIAAVNAGDDFGDTPLFCAVRINSFDMANTLLKAGASVNVRNIDSQTPLHIAAASVHNSIDIAQLLLEYDALVNVPDRYGCIPLVLSLRSFILREPWSVARLLIQHGSVLNHPNTVGALEWAVLSNGNVDLLRTAVDAGLHLAGLVWAKDLVDGTGSGHSRWLRSEQTEQKARLIDYIKHTTMNAACLFGICRAAIREHLIVVARGESTYFRIQRLPLPDIIRLQLLLEDE